MSISGYYKERDKLLAEQKAEREVMLDADVAADEIDRLHDEDYKAWKANRVFTTHNSVSSEELGEESVSLLWLRRNPWDGSGEESEGLGLLDSIGNGKLLAALKALNPDDLALAEACLVTV